MSPEVAEIISAFSTLSERRKVFHSESDLQHELAWQLRLNNRALEPRLEVRLTDPPGEIDILLRSDARRVGIELKYARGPLTCTHNGEPFNLPGTDPKDATRYHFWKDVQRLESWLIKGHLDTAVAILLANDPACWRTPGPRETNDHAFRFHEGATCSGTLSFRREPPKPHNWPPILLRAPYTCTWTHFSNVDNQPNAEFRFLAVEARL